MISRLQRIPWLWLALLGYYLPWVWHKAAGLTFNAYDLAEWVSIHPAVRVGNPPLVAPFLLRSLLYDVALLAALHSLRTGRWRWLYIGLAVVLAITLLPPLDFFAGAFNDPNYQQQMFIAAATFITLVAVYLLRGRLTRWRWLPHLEALTAALSIVAAISGVVMALDTMRSVQVFPTIGGGVVLYVVSLISYGLASFAKSKNSM